MYILFYSHRIGDYFVCHREALVGTPKGNARYRTIISEGDNESLLEEECERLRKKL
jgi:hypothetical protein